jgi:isocitrate dehydrogenase kinase/phosphatase
MPWRRASVNGDDQLIVDKPPARPLARRAGAAQAGLMIWPPPRDFGTLRTEQIAYAGLAELQAARSAAEAAEVLAGLILAIFRDYYARSRRIPWLAKAAFEQRDWAGAIALSQERIAIYALAAAKAAAILKHAIEEQAGGGFWPAVEARYEQAAAGAYEADLALAFLASVRRLVFEQAWTPVAYDATAGAGPRRPPAWLRRLAAPGRMTPALAEALLAAPGLAAPFRERAGDAAAVAARINAELGLDGAPRLRGVEVLEAGFYRNRGAYVVGALELADGRSPLALALLHGPEGVQVDAVILRETTLRHVFSSTLANFHVTITDYHELVDYLFGLTPTRPRGMHYSTAFNYPQVWPGELLRVQSR